MLPKILMMGGGSMSGPMGGQMMMGPGSMSDGGGGGGHLQMGNEGLAQAQQQTMTGTPAQMAMNGQGMANGTQHQGTAPEGALDINNFKCA